MGTSPQADSMIEQGQKQIEMQPPQVMPPVQQDPTAGTAMQPGQVFQAPPEQAPPPQMMPPQVAPPTLSTGMPPQQQMLPPQAAVPPQQQVPPQQLPPETGVPPVTDQGMLPPEVQPGPVPDGTGIDQEPPSVFSDPVTPEEQAAQGALDAAQAEGKQFALGPGVPMTPPEAFQQDIASGQPGTAPNPRQIERMRRKRLALLNPKVQQLRPWGRGNPNIRYQGGPAFEGAFQPQQPRPPQQQAQVASAAGRAGAFAGQRQRLAR